MCRVKMVVMVARQAAVVVVVGQVHQQVQVEMEVLVVEDKCGFTLGK
jgi:hypothetical protein